MKYIDADKLITKLQPFYDEAKDKFLFSIQTGTSTDCAKWEKAVWIYEYVLRLITALQQEQPEKRNV